MDEIFETVLAICLDRQADGDSAAACAADFPEFPQLLPLLKLAAALGSLAPLEVDSSWLTSSSDRVISRIGKPRGGAAQP